MRKIRKSRTITIHVTLPACVPVKHDDFMIRLLLDEALRNPCSISSVIVVNKAQKELATIEFRR